MKAHSTVAQSILILLLVLPQPIPCQQAVHCRWAPYGEWSECNSCSRTKVRTRHVEVYAQFGGTPCQGQASQVALCESQKGCPLLAGCGERFRCTSGQCISRSLVCNGDQDCEGGLDERGCDPQSRHDACDMDKTPPNSDLTGSGYDVLTGKLRAGVINTRSFGGQCRKVFSGDHSTFYRLPQSILRYNFEVSVDNDESDESYNSSWSYMRHIQENALIGHDRRTFHKELNENKASKLLILKNRVELAQFQNSAAPYLTLAEDFWKALSSLPITYDYPAYRRLLQTYGTHYMSEGSLGGMYQALLEFDRQSLDSTSTTDTEYQRCWRKVKRRLFRKKVKTVCEKLTSSLKSSNGHSSNRLQFKTQLIGGNTAFSGALGVLDVENPELNGEVYARWASSVKDFPDVINQKLRPLSELVKETQCSGLKRLHLQRATEQYLAEEHPCHCRPCRNNGRPLLTGTECTCICRPGTEGKACEQGHAIGEQPGVIHGSWNCWSSWSSCSRGQRSRTRSCTNPSPEMGGLHCPGVAVEHKPCEEPDIRHLQMMEPQCFSLSATPPKTCGLPPNLRNGFVANPKDAYVVGSLVEYSCVGGHYLMGEATARCTDAQTWRTGPMECKRTTCTAPHLSNNVKGAPAKVFYDIGDKVFLSCPGDAALQGYVSQIICNPSLQWSPSPNVAACIQAIPKTTAPPSGLTCKPWEVVGRAQCVCKMPSQCLPSLPLCARIGDGVGEGPGRLLGACQLGALRCLGRGFTLARDTDCVWPKETPPACPHCRAWETCQGRCECRDPAQCAGGSAFLCVAREGGGAPLRMTECEVGARRCAGENVAVTAIDDC